jgi:hypothetical protein
VSDTDPVRYALDAMIALGTPEALAQAGKLARQTAATAATAETAADLGLLTIKQMRSMSPKEMSDALGDPEKRKIIFRSMEAARTV